MQNPDEDMLMSLTAQLSQQVSDGANTNTIEHNSITFEYKVNINRMVLRFFRTFFDFQKKIVFKNAKLDFLRGKTVMLFILLKFYFEASSKC